MKSAGQYNTRFIRLKYSKAKEGSYGQEKETWTEAEQLWGYANELTAGKMIAFGQRGSEATVEIHLRNYPELNHKDRLKGKESGEVFELEGIVQGDNELVIPAKRRL